MSFRAATAGTALACTAARHGDEEGAMLKDLKFALRTSCRYSRRTVRMRDGRIPSEGLTERL